MRVIVTGASGFLGRAIYQNLIAQGIDCVGVARSDVFGLQRVSSYSDAPVGDCLIHCAETSDRTAANSSGENLASEARNTLEDLLAKRYSQVVYASSAVLYGDHCATPRGISDQVFATDIYTHIKLASEQRVLEHGGVVARLSNLYGPGMAQGNVLGTILGQLGRPGPVKLKNTAPVRDFLLIEDAARAFLMLSASKKTGIYNVGSGVGTSIAELASLTLVEAGEAGRPVVSVQSGDVFSNLVLDISATSEAVGWVPRVPLREGIRQLLQSLRNKHE